jgi:hypothetical protein
MLTTRTRGLPGVSNLGGFTSRRIRKILPNGSQTISFQRYDHVNDVSIPGKQVTASEGHPFRRARKGALEDLGGPFRTQKSYVKSPLEADVHYFPEVYSSALDAYVRDVYTGVMLPGIPSAFPPSGESSDIELTKAGATAIARCKPTNSVANLATSLGELFKDGLPHLISSRGWQSKAQSARQAGDEYLNYQFGWRPLVSDITSFGLGVIRVDAAIRQLERDAGKVVRRSYYFPTKTSRTTDVLQASAAPIGPLVNPNNFSKFGALVRTRETVQRQWFAGAFSYHMPVGLDSRTKLGRYALLADRLGLKLTPDTLWSLAPWSWAIDWFSNTGDVISNLSDFAEFGLVMRYGYLMEHTIVSDTYTLEGAVEKDGRPFNCPPLVLVTETKIRKQANPYGFGVSWDTLSTFQLSILSALGITRR